ncbi:hypothetical protein OSSY52_07420 [Tepiditoga spiralis]|uniref:FAD-dependent protein C-terminal domain-containing protein n=1 Tax=Tepiditoga spiralis TaxID=2108365 RepID=A0A7G1G2M9_9BACT|nr:hypothetical protein [Tepiditoga spiralis]BBE30601.1 hypothetical protein OSSY52_07420 [Tepiditoga spiralis]
MLRINNVKLPITHNDEDIKRYIAEKININKSSIKSIKIAKQSIDARKKREMIYFIYSIDFEVENENKIKTSLVTTSPNKNYEMPTVKNKPKLPPIIIGSGPAGLFTGLILAECGLNPIILERGKSVDARKKDINLFWNNGILNTESNVQFGEGGAGTFSDGKLTTLIKDKFGRIKKVLEEFVESGAPKDILYKNKPHIGTDILEVVVKNIRKKITKLGGTIKFQHKVTDLIIENNEAKGVIINNKEKLYSNDIVLAIGHSARDTFKMLYENNLLISQKPFSIGVRIEHLREMIDKSQYGKFFNHPKLGAADYKLSYRTKANRAVYTFCMCPGGQVIASSSEENMIVTNGMSKHARNLKNSNSAILVNVETKDFKSSHPLAGIEFQRYWESEAFKLSNSYKAPSQLFNDFLNNRKTKKFGEIKPSYIPGVALQDLNKCLPNFVSSSLKEGILIMNNKIHGFSDNNAILTGVETRSSSPIRIDRNEFCESTNTKNLYPCGEGAGYAGGITSSAVDGIRIAENIIKKYR